jgi:transmembrane sensor
VYKISDGSYARKLAGVSDMRDPPVRRAGHRPGGEEGGDVGDGGELVRIPCRRVKVMRSRRFWNRRRQSESSAEIEKALEAGARTYAAADPATPEQWRVLNASITSRPHVSPRAARERWAWVLRPAAGLVLATAAVAVVLVLQRPGGDATVYETARGEQTTLTLGDGSEILINHTSALKVEPAVDARARRVELTGEAFFRVRRTGTPFLVTTRAGTVSLLGTAFNVRMRGGRMEVAVVEGKVRVTGPEGAWEGGVVLEAGELTTCAERGVPQPPAPIRRAVYPGWIHGQLLFDRTPLSEACREIEGHFDIEVDLQVPHADTITITGALDAKNADLAISALARLTGTTSQHDQNGYTLR